jgi:hypothetical protein
MHEYEIRLLRADQTTTTVLEAMHVNDNDATRAAKKIAEAGLFEVWRDLDCIYGKGHDLCPPTAGRILL